MTTQPQQPLDVVTGGAPVRLLRLKQVHQLVPMSRSTIYAWCAEGKFPKPIKLGDSKTVVWVSSEVEEFVARVIAERGGA